jgi:hypothetical protein
VLLVGLGHVGRDRGVLPPGVAPEVGRHPLWPREKISTVRALTRTSTCVCSGTKVYGTE